MKLLMILVVLFSMTGCIEEENCYETGVVDHYKTETTEYYTVSVPVYKVICE